MGSRRVWFLLVCVIGLAAAGGQDRSDLPNVLIVLADDLGYGDLGCYGNEVVRTPHLDGFAAEGMRFTDCYAAAANCSPARTGLMTGRTPYRVGIFSAIPFMSPMHVGSGEVTIATLLAGAGYETCHVGKWHLNGLFNLPGQPQPDDHGFGHWFSTQNNALPNHRNPYNFVRNGIPVGPLEGYAADLVVAEAAEWLRDKRDESRPFFMYVCFHEPHEPIATAERYEAMYEAFEDPSQRAHHGNITQMDAAFGRLMGVVDELGLREDTLVFFTSDNGPALTRYHPYGSAGSLRAKKGHVYEGGIRVPGIVRWPGRVAPGAVSEEAISGVDLLPTLCAVAGVAVPEDRALDGADIVPVLEGRALERATPLYWHFNLATSDVKVAMREGDWKLCARLDREAAKAGGGLTAEQMSVLKEAELTGFELYHLRRDAGETEDLSKVEPERFAAMKAKLEERYREVRDEAPVWPEWEPVRYEAGRIEWPGYEALISPPR
ncbi:MAG: sulfatase-like hydrolase/transferase [Verrucomicrobiota bacterium]